jgi:hypothetical protein
MKIALGVCILAAIGGAALAAGTKPDFSGTWKLDPLMSRFSKDLPPPKSRTITIQQHDPKLHIEIKTESKTGNRDHVFDLTIDGAETKSSTSGDDSTTASISWGDIDGTRLVLTIKEQSSSGPVVITRVMKRGSNGKMLTTVLIVEAPTGEQEADEFYNLQ